LTPAASPAYLKKHGRPKTPADLAAHSVIVGPAGMSSGGWSFQKGSRNVSIRVDSRLAVTVNEAAVAAAVAGIGIVTTSLWGCRAELASGRLLQVLADWKMPQVEVHGLFTPGRAPKPAARAFVQYLIGELRG
jgi:DNA-binding transcriptional LysR family regulator